MSEDKRVLVIVTRHDIGNIQDRPIQLEDWTAWGFDAEFIGYVRENGTDPSPITDLSGIAIHKTPAVIWIRGQAFDNNREELATHIRSIRDYLLKEELSFAAAFHGDYFIPKMGLEPGEVNDYTLSDDNEVFLSYGLIAEADEPDCRRYNHLAAFDNLYRFFLDRKP